MPMPFRGRQIEACRFMFYRFTVSQRHFSRLGTRFLWRGRCAKLPQWPQNAINGINGQPFHQRYWYQRFFHGRRTQKGKPFLVLTSLCATRRLDGQQKLEILGMAKACQPLPVKLGPTPPSNEGKSPFTKGEMLKGRIEKLGASQDRHSEDEPNCNVGRCACSTRQGVDLGFSVNNMRT